MAKLFANSGDSDQTPCSAVSDLGLHCLPITLLWVSWLQWVKIHVFWFHVARLRGQVDEVVDVMKSNVSKVVERGDRLEDLQDKSGNDAQCFVQRIVNKRITWAAMWVNIPYEDLNQHLSCLIRVFVVRMMTHCSLGYLKYTLRRIWSDGANAQADLNLHWAHMSGTFYDALAHVSIASVKVFLF